MTQNIPHAHGADEAETAATKVGLELPLTDENLARLARIMDMVRAATKAELAAELTDLDHADAVETLRANGLA